MTRRDPASGSMGSQHNDAPVPSELQTASWNGVLGEVARDRVNQVVFVVATIVVAFLYSLLLPFDFTQRFSIANWQYLDARLIAWSLVLAMGMASVVALQVHAIRRIAAARTRTGALGGLAFVGSVLPSLLCCTPAIPTFLVFVGFSTVTVYGTTGTLQHFFATHQTQFFIGSLLLMTLAAWWSMRRITRAACLANGCEPASRARKSRRSDEALSSVTRGAP